jgi:hypothetical protein
MDDNSFRVWYDGRRLHVEERLLGQNTSAQELDLLDAGKATLALNGWIQELRRRAQADRRPRGGRRQELR